MKLPPQTVRKLMRESFSGSNPIVVDRGNLRDVSKSLRSRLETIDGLRLTQHPGDRDSRSRTLCRFTIPDPHQFDQYYRSDEIRLEFDAEARMLVRSYRWRDVQFEAFVSDLDEVGLFVRHVLRRYARRNANAQKREKVREFKSKAIIAQVRKLAMEEKFDFATRNDSVKLRLFVKLSKQHLIEISVPFTQFEKVLPKLRTTILSLRELYDEGLRFKIAPIGHLPWDVEWIRHEKTEPG